MELNRQKHVLNIRPAEREDIPALRGLIGELAGYEKRRDELLVDEKSLEKWIFERGEVSALIGEEGGNPVGYVIYYPVFSSFKGTGRLYVEDVFVLRECRGRGYGKSLLAEVAARARETGYDGLQWSCLDWNEPAIGFYESLGAHKKPGSVIFVLDGAEMESLTHKV